MSEWKSYRKESRSDYGTKEVITLERIQLGALLRIADGMEAMAKSHTVLVEEKEEWRQQLEWCEEDLERKCRQNAALRGVITKLKRGRK